MTKEEILSKFKDINYAYNDCCAFDNLRKMLYEFEKSIREECKRNIICNGVDDISIKDSIKFGCPYFYWLHGDVSGRPPYVDPEKCEHCDVLECDKKEE
jgi:hypothetical protein